MPTKKNKGKGNSKEERCKKEIGKGLVAKLGKVITEKRDHTKQGKGDIPNKEKKRTQNRKHAKQREQTKTQKREQMQTKEGRKGNIFAT